MSNRIILRSAPSSNRRQPLLESQFSKKSTIVGEVVGGTTAECVAVCCCCPLGVFNFLVLAFYKVPFGLCRRMLRQRRRRKILKKGLSSPAKIEGCSCGSCDFNGLHQIYPLCENDASDFERLYAVEDPHDDVDALALEKEMWDRFYSAGFWRSSSRRDYSEPISPNVEFVDCLESQFDV